ncbi:MAG: AAA family ATPase [Paracoccaceae bacterium]
MKIRSITLENVRRFIEPVSIGPIGDGITLLSEPNEAGKSTLFDALHALFFIKHSSKTAEIKSLRPHSGGKIAVECTLDIDAETWRVRKEWMTGAFAKIWRNGTLVHQGDAAEDWLAALSSGDAGGPGGLLWVRQGRVTLNKPSKQKNAEQELSERRNLLTAISGAMDQVTGGERMDQVLARVEDDLGKLQTTTGKPKSGGRWSEAESTVATLEAKESELAGTVGALHDALDERRRLQRELSDLEDPDTAQTRTTELQNAEDALREAKGLDQKLRALETEATLAQQTSETAQSEAKRREEVQEAAENTQKAHETAQKTAEEARSKHDTAAEASQAATTTLENAKVSREKARDVIQQINAAKTTAHKQAERTRLTDLIEKADAAEAERIKQHALAQQGPDAETATWIEALAHEIETQTRALAASAPRVSATYIDGAEHIRFDGQPLLPDQTLPLPESGLIEMPGIGTLHVKSQDRDPAAALAKAKSDLTEALKAGNWPDIPAFLAAKQARADAKTAADTAQNTRDTLAPDGIEALREALAILGEAAETDTASLPDETTARADLDTATSELGEAETEAAEAREIAQAATIALATAENTADLAKSVADNAKTALDNLPPQDPEAARIKLADLDRKAETASATYLALKEAAPDIAALKARRDRLKTVVDTATQEAARLRERIGTLNGRIETRSEEGVEETLAETREKLTAARETLARVVFEKDVLACLSDTLDQAQKAARDTYFAPVSAELKPLLATVWDDAEIEWSDDDLLPKALIRKGTEEPLDILSGGTQEQIAFLVRLAFARLLAKSGRHTPLILDDALVYSDDDRIEKMFDTLHGAATDLQIIVLTCRQRAFVNLGAPKVSFQKSNSAATI